MISCSLFPGVLRPHKNPLAWRGRAGLLGKVQWISTDWLRKVVSLLKSALFLIPGHIFRERAVHHAWSSHLSLICLTRLNCCQHACFQHVVAMEALWAMLACAKPHRLKWVHKCDLGSWDMFNFGWAGPVVLMKSFSMTRCRRNGIWVINPNFSRVKWAAQATCTRASHHLSFRFLLFPFLFLSFPFLVMDQMLGWVAGSPPLAYVNGEGEKERGGTIFNPVMLHEKRERLLAKRQLQHFRWKLSVCVDQRGQLALPFGEIINHFKALMKFWRIGFALSFSAILGCFFLLHEQFMHHSFIHRNIKKYTMWPGGNQSKQNLHHHRTQVRNVRRLYWLPKLAPLIAGLYPPSAFSDSDAA